MSRSALIAGALGASLLVLSSIAGTDATAQTFSTPPGYRQTVHAGGTVNENPGQIVREIGDIDGDQLTDFAIGAPMASFGGRRSVGKTYVIYGERTPRPMQLTALAPELGGDGNAGFEIVNPISHGGQAGGSFRLWLAGLGDIDADGFGDFALSDPLQVLVAPFESAVFVMFGGTRIVGPSAGRVDLLQVPNPVLGDRLVRFARVGLFGAAISGLGDFNDDGFDDFAMSFYSEGNCTIEVYFGPIARSQPSPSLKLTQAESAGCLGGGLVGGSDVNGDDVPDLHACTGESPVPSGRACYVLFGGNPAPLGLVFQMQRLRAANGGDGSLGFVLFGAVNYFLGTADSGVAIDADLNGDGINDLVYGSPEVDLDPDPISQNHGRVSVFFGRRTFLPEFDLGRLLPENGGNGREGFVLDAPLLSRFGLGYSISRAGDFNRDGVDDIAIGLDRGHNYEGIRSRLLVVFGRGPDATPFPARTVVDRTAIATGFATEIVGGSDTSGFGWSIDGIRDLDGDGRDELLVGAPLARVNGLLRGMGVLYSSATTSPVGVPSMRPSSLWLAVIAFLVTGGLALASRGSRY